MAKTITFGQALDLIRSHVSPKYEDGFAASICNIATAKAWEVYDFRETLADLPPFYPTPGGQYHGAPAVVIPSDFMGLREAYLVYLASNPPRYQPLPIVKFLKDTGVESIPRDICYDPKLCSFKLFPRVTQSVGAPQWIVTGTYKRKPPRVTAENYNTTLLPFDDMYLYNFLEVMKWAAFNLSGDPRAGEIAADKNGNYRATGQCAKAIAALADMAANEGLELGDPAIAPAEGLVGNGNYLFSQWYL